MEVPVGNTLGVNVKKGFLTKDEASEFLDDAVEHGYRISRKMVDDVLLNLE